MKPKILFSLFCGFLFFTSSYAGETEPNNTRAQANTVSLNGSNNGHISPAGDVDWYKVTTTSDGRLDVLVNDFSQDYTNFYLYDNNGTTLLNSGTVGSNTSATFSTDALAAGTYYIEFTGYNTASDTSTYSFTNTLTAAPVANDAEPDSTKAQALTLPLDGSATGHVGYYYNNHRDSSDWYKVTLNSDGLLRLTVTTYPATNNDYINYYLYDNNGTTLLNSGTTGSNTTLVFNTDGLAAGTYYIKMSQYSPNDYVSYELADSLFITPVRNDAEPDSTRALALTLPLDGSTTGHVGYYYNNHRDTSDWYKVTLNSDGLLRLTVTTEPSSLNAYINYYLYDNNGTTVLNSNTTGANTTAVFNTDGLAAGTYYIKMSQYSPNDYVSYNLADSLFTPPVQNDAEPDSNRALALTLPLDGSITGHVGYYYNNHRDTSDWYKVTLNSDGLLRLTVTTEPSSLNAYINYYLYDNNGTTVLNSNTTGANTTTVFNTDGLAAGTYYIKMSQYSPNDYVSYKLADSLFTYAYAADTLAEPNAAAYLAKTLMANRTTTGHFGFYYNNQRDTTDWWKINYTGTTGTLDLTLNHLPHLDNGAVDYVNFYVYKDTSASSIYQRTFGSETSDVVNLTGLAQGYYYIKITQYNNNDFEAYSITDSFTQVNKATISLLKAASSVSSCGSDSLVYKLGASHSPYTVRLYRDGVLYDSVTTATDTARFTGLNDGNYYAKVYGDGATDSAYNKSAVSQFLPAYPTGLTTISTTATTATLNWLHPACVQNYRLQYKPTGSPTFITVNTPTGFSGNFTLTGLIPNTVYIWQVASVDSSNSLVSRYSATATFNTMSVLPVTLLNFRGTLHSSEALLSWSTATEVNNKGFEVEKSKDGQTFIVAGFVKGAGNSSSITNYSFADNNIESGFTYYRLKQIDLDGNFTYSSIIRLEYSNFEWSVSDNPLTSASSVQLQLGKKANVAIEIISADGKIIKSINKGNIMEGIHTILLNMFNEPSGVYIIKLIVDNQHFSKTIIR